MTRKVGTRGHLAAVQEGLPNPGQGHEVPVRVGPLGFSAELGDSIVERTLDEEAVGCFGASLGIVSHAGHDGEAEDSSDFP